MPNDGRALTDNGVERIQKRFYKGNVDDHEINRLFETIKVQRQVLSALFKLFQEHPTRRESVTDPVRNSTLAYFKERVAMEDPQW